MVEARNYKFGTITLITRWRKKCKIRTQMDEKRSCDLLLELFDSTDRENCRS